MRHDPENEWSPESVAHHEAAHAVALYLYGFGTGYLTIRPNRDEYAAGMCSAAENRPDQFEGLLVSLCAGYAATCRFRPKDDAYSGAQHDLQLAREECLLRNLEFVEAYWIAKAETFVDAEWPVIQALAKETLIHRELDYIEIEFIIEAARTTDVGEAEQFRQRLEYYRRGIKRGDH